MPLGHVVAGIPILFHVGGEEKMSMATPENGGEKVKDFHGGDELTAQNMAIPLSIWQTMTALIFDGVFDRHPNLKFGVIERAWLPSFRFWIQGSKPSVGRGALPRPSMKPRLAERQHESHRIAMNQPVDPSGVQPRCCCSHRIPHVEAAATWSNALRTTWKALATRRSVAFTETTSLI